MTKCPFEMSLPLELWIFGNQRWGFARMRISGVGSVYLVILWGIVFSFTLPSIRIRKAQEMVENPLTEDQMNLFLDDFNREFHRTYNKILRCGAISEEEAKPDSFVIARCALVIAAAKYRPAHPEHKEMLKNLEAFV